MTGRETAASCSATPSVNQDENPVKKKRETDEDECSVFADAATTFSFRSYRANKQVYSLFKKQSFGLSFEITFMLWGITQSLLATCILSAPTDLS